MRATVLNDLDDFTTENVFKELGLELLDYYYKNGIIVMVGVYTDEDYEYRLEIDSKRHKDYEHTFWKQIITDGLKDKYPSLFV